MTFLDFKQRAKSTAPTPNCLIALDPGETTGYALFVQGKLSKYGELETPYIRLAVKTLWDFFDEIHQEFGVFTIVMEDYRIYSWKTEQHTWSALHTPQLLGIVEAIAYSYGCYPVRQMAKLAKGFCTDTRLAEWSYYVKGLKHARDAIRHGCYYLLFHKSA